MSASGAAIGNGFRFSVFGFPFAIHMAFAVLPLHLRQGYGGQVGEGGSRRFSTHTHTRALS
jgi:hypothetical protein